MNNKKKIFIGSSNESLAFAKQIKQFFSEMYDCTIWQEDFFTLNISTYDNLLKRAIAFDYAIFVGGRDDLVKRTKFRKSKISPRDNIYLEFGLYAGILSPKRTFFIIDKACKIASDLNGITLCLFKNENDINSCCEIINKHINEENKIARVGLLPSLSLAIGYYDNFLKDICYRIRELNEVCVDGEVYDVSCLKKEIKIIIPSDIESNWGAQALYYYDTNNMIKYNVGNTKNYYIRLDYNTLKNNKKLSFVDIPQTLMSSFKTVEYIAGKDFVGENDLLVSAKIKEVNNFIDALELRINEDKIVKSIASVVYYKDQLETWRNK